MPPSISGTVAHGNVLTVTPGTWTGSPSITGQWYAGASAITGETGSTYTVDRADVSIGPDITYVEDPGGGGTPEPSNALSYYPTQDYRGVWDLAEDVTLVGSDIDSIGDQGSVGTMAAAASGNRPAHSASDSDFSSEPTAAFDGGTEYLRVVAASMGGSLAYYAPGACARIITGVGNNDRLIDYNNRDNVRCSVGSGVPYLTISATHSVSAVNVRDSTRTILGVATYGGAQSIYVSGTQEAATTNPTSGPPDGLVLALGGSTSGTLTMPVRVSLVVLGVSSDSVSSRAALDLEAYCAWRFGAV